MPNKNGAGEAISPVSIPPYPHRHSGPAIVAGSAWCLADDLEGAQKLFPDAAFIAVNRTAMYYRCDMIVAIDREWAKPFREAQEAKFGTGHFTLHGGRIGAKKYPEAYPWMDYFWPDLQTGGTSSWTAAKIAVAIGYSPVILCGVPLEDGPYFYADDPEQAHVKSLWIGRKGEQMDAYRNPVIRDAPHYSQVKSMSGFTRELFGAP